MRRAVAAAVVGGFAGFAAFGAPAGFGARAALAAGPHAAAPATRTMAVTIDDLPYVQIGGRPDLARARRATRAILAALEAHGAPAVGFVNADKLQVPGEVDARTALLQQWVDAGMQLGNHTWSHPNLNRMTAAAFEQDVVRGGEVVRRLMAPRHPARLYFRHPMNHTGDTAAKKAAVDRFLAARGYTIAPHTVENEDFVFNAVYVQARRDGDGDLARRLRDAYLDFSLRATAFAERVAPEVFGRDVPQTLLIHANDLNADVLDALLRRFEARGYRFVTLDEAMDDPAYRTPDTLVSSYGPTWLWRWMKSQGLHVSFADDPEPPAWVTDLFAHRDRGGRQAII